MFESDYQRILLLAVPTSFPDWRFFRRNSGLVPMADGRRFRSAVPGQCDLYAIQFETGRHVEIELKNAGKKLSKEQENWRLWCLAWSVPYALLTVSRDDASPEATVSRWIGELRAALPTRTL